MTTAPAQTLQQLDDPEPGSTWFWSLASIVAFVVVVVASSAFFFQVEGLEVDQKVVDQPAANLENLRASQREELSVYGNYQWILPDGKTATFTRVPIDRAMELYVLDAKKAPRTLPVTAPSVPAVTPGVQKSSTTTAAPGVAK